MFLTTKERVTLQQSVKEACKVFGPSVPDVMFNGRQRPYNKARQAIIYTLISLNKFSRYKISIFFSCDCSCIIYAQNKMDKLLAKDTAEVRELKVLLEKAKEAIKAVFEKEDSLDQELDPLFENPEDPATKIIAEKRESSYSSVMHKLDEIKSLVISGGSQSNELVRRGMGYVKELKIPVYRCQLQPKDDDLLEEFGAWFNGYWAVRTDGCSSKDWSWAIKAILQAEQKNFPIVFIEPK